MHRTMYTCLLLISTFTCLDNLVYSKRRVRPFPADFWFGASTAAYQIEGGWQEDGKSPSIWDEVVHTRPYMIKDGNNADVAADSYHLYKKDIQIAKDLGLHFYKFSISWPRILPNGFADKINDLGVQYYNNLIDEMLAHNITPMATMYQWDLPNNLQKFGGWANNLIVTWFLDYAKVLFSKFGHKVKYWVTVNDPKHMCVGGYGYDIKAPMLNMSGIAEYICAKNVLLSHAGVYHWYDEHYRKMYSGMIGIALNFYWFEPLSDSYDDRHAARDAKMFDWGLFAQPIFSKSGDYPSEVKRNICLKSAEQGFPRCRLPELSATEVSLIRGSADFLGVNTYSTQMTYRDASLMGMYDAPSFMDDMGAVLTKEPSWTQSSSGWSAVPSGLYKLLMNLKKEYDNPPIFVTENGWSNEGGLVDGDRISYLKTYLNALLNAIDEGCDIKGYSVWSLIDSFEWLQGYTQKFGLYEVDFSSPEKTRAPRKSALIYKEIIRTMILDPNYEPEKFVLEAMERHEKQKENNEDWK